MAEQVRSRYRVAGLAYFALGMSVAVITFAAGLVPEQRQMAGGPGATLAAFAAVFAAFAALIYHAHRHWSLRLVAGALLVTNSWRAAVFTLNSVGWHAELIPPQVVPIQPRPLALINTALLALIVLSLARAVLMGGPKVPLLSDLRTRMLTSS